MEDYARWRLAFLSVIEQLFPVGKRRLFNSDGAKTDGKSLETQDHCALELFAHELIHGPWNCSIVNSLPRILPEEQRYSWSTMSSSEL